MKDTFLLSELYLRGIEILKIKILIALLFLFTGLLNFFDKIQIISPRAYIFASLSYFLLLALSYFIFLKLKRENYYTFLIISFILDGLFVTTILYVSGGIESITFILYFLYLLLFSFFGLRKSLYYILFSYILLYLGEIFSETFGVIPHFYSSHIYPPDFIYNPRLVSLRCLPIAGYMILYTLLLDKSISFFTRTERKMELLVESTLFLTRGIGDRDKILKELIKTAIKITGADSTSIMVKENGEWKFILWENIEDDVVKKVEEEMRSSLPANIREIEETKKTLYYPDTREVPAWIRDAKSPVKSYIGVPIIIGDKVVAIINIDSWKPNKFTQSDVRIAETLARFAEVVMEKHSLFERLDALKKEAEELAIKDYLTGLYNRRELERMLSYEISKSIRYDSSFQLMMIDLDEFKSINDAFGHPEGDRVLKKFAEILKESVRKTDLVFRYGGDEFIVFVPGDDKMAVEKISKRIRDKFNKEFKTYIEELSFDFSFGHLVFPDDVGDVNEESEGVKLALKRVDEFLYYRKRRET